MHIAAKPYFEDGLDHETPELIRGQTALIWCNASGFPPPKIKWSTVRILLTYLANLALESPNSYLDLFSL